MLAHLASNVPQRAVVSARRAISLQVPASPRARSRALTVSAVRAQHILHGSKEAKEAGDLEVQQHSRTIARGKYLHGIESASRACKYVQLNALSLSSPQFIESSRIASKSIRRLRTCISCVLVARRLFKRSRNVASVITRACGTIPNFGSSSRAILRPSLESKTLFVCRLSSIMDVVLTLCRSRSGVRESLRL